MMACITGPVARLLPCWNRFTILRGVAFLAQQKRKHQRTILIKSHLTSIAKKVVVVLTLKTCPVTWLSNNYKINNSKVIKHPGVLLDADGPLPSGEVWSIFCDVKGAEPCIATVRLYLLNFFQTWSKEGSSNRSSRNRLLSA